MADRDEYGKGIASLVLRQIGLKKASVTEKTFQRMRAEAELAGRKIAAIAAIEVFGDHAKEVAGKAIEKAKTKGN